MPLTKTRATGLDNCNQAKVSSTNSGWSEVLTNGYRVNVLWRIPAHFATIRARSSLEVGGLAKHISLLAMSGSHICPNFVPAKMIKGGNTNLNCSKLKPRSVMKNITNCQRVPPFN
jgi:hypothetical protein